MGVVCAHAHKKLVLTKNFRDGKRTETRRVSVLSIPAFNHCVSHYVLHVHCVQWNAGMGNTDTLHPISCFCSFSIPTSRIKFLLLVYV